MIIQTERTLFKKDKNADAVKAAAERAEAGELLHPARAIYI